MDLGDADAPLGSSRGALSLWKKPNSALFSKIGTKRFKELEKETGVRSKFSLNISRNCDPTPVVLAIT